MQTTTKRRTQTAFRFRSDLLARLKEEAAKQNRTLNNYVKSVLMDVITVDVWSVM